MTIPNVKINLDELQTGDIILFGDTKFWFSRLIEWVCNSKWSHVGVILRDPTYINPNLKGLYLWESGEEDYPDSEDGVIKFGVQINKFENTLREGYNGYIYYRKLNANIPDIENKIKLIHDSVHNKPYDINILDFMESSSKTDVVEKPVKRSDWRIVNWWRGETIQQKESTFFCSALVGYIYTHLGLLPASTHWTECTPQFFSSSENKSLKLLNGAELADEKLLYKKDN